MAASDHLGKQFDAVSGRETTPFVGLANDGQWTGGAQHPRPDLYKATGYRQMRPGPPKGCVDNIDPFGFDPDSMLAGRLCSSCTTRREGVEDIGVTVEEMIADPTLTRAPVNKRGALATSG